MVQRVLVPVDGSSYSEEVLPYARGIVEATGARLELLRVVEKDSDHDEASRHVRSLADGLQVEAKTVPHRDDIADAILAEAAGVPDTLVAGRAAPLPEPARFTTVMLPLDGSDLSEGMQEQAGEWARALKARLLVVQVISPDSKPDQQIPVGDTFEHSYVRARAVSVASRYGVEPSWEVLHGDPVDAISSFLEGRRDVLVVMATRGRTALQSVVLGSVTRGLVHRSGVPIVIRMS